jgi:basic membrane protein A
VKRVDNGVFAATQKVIDGNFKGGGNLLFNLKNKGMDVGKINPAVPKNLIDKMNELKQKIISGQVKVPSTL